jgi:hypothetical protein
MTKARLDRQLTVGHAPDDDVYKDIIRIAQADRGDLPTGRAYRVSANGRTAFFILRGVGPGAAGKALLDEAARDKLGVKAGEAYRLSLVGAGFLDELRWMWTATDPTYRAAGRLGVLSLALGIISLVLAAPPLVQWAATLVR